MFAARSTAQRPAVNVLSVTVMGTATLGINHPWFVRNRWEIFREWPPIVIHSYANEGRQQSKLNNEAHPKGYLYGSLCRAARYDSHTFVYLFRKIIVMFMRLDFCLTVHHQLGKVTQMNQLDATMIY